MKRFWICLLILLVAIPAVAQSDDVETYEFDTGTTLEYPEDWDAELNDGILSIAGSTPTQVLVLDYPIVRTLSEDGEVVSGLDAVEILSNILLDTTIDPDDIYEFKMGSRNVAAYDINLALSGAVYAVEFTNGAMGMLVTIEVDEDIETDMLQSFDNSEDVVNDVALPSGRNSVIRDEPSVYLFQQTNQRFLIPAGWSVIVRQLDDIPYAVLTVPDDEVTVQLFDLSLAVTKGTELDEVLDNLEIDWEADFEVEIQSDASTYSFSDREAISYDIEVDGTEGLLVVLRFSDDAIGLVLIYGDDVADYDSQINQLIGSFNNFGALIDYMQ